MDTHAYKPSGRQKILIQEILELAWQTGSLVEIVDFRASHPDDRGALDDLIASGMLARDGQGVQYRVDVLGLAALATPRATGLLERGDILAKELRRRFGDRTLRTTPYTVREIQELWAVSAQECTLILLHLKDILYLWGAGLVHQIGHPDAAIALGGEGILDYPSIATVIDQLRAWRSQHLAQPVATMSTTQTTGDPSLLRAWPAVRACLHAFSFNDIKEVAGLAGFDLTTVSTLVQKPEKSSTKGQLMSGVDAGFGKMDDLEKRQFLTILIEEILRRRPDMEDQLAEYLSRLGWSFSGGTLSPLSVLDPADLPETPEESRRDLLKAAQRFRDGDLSGAISAACGAIDSVTAHIYQQRQLGDPTSASFQERCKRAAEARGVLPGLEKQLAALGWPESEIVPFKKNFAGALNQGAYVMQTLRSRMGDVHGSKPILKPLVFDCVKWAELVVGSLLERHNSPY